MIQILIPTNRGIKTIMINNIIRIEASSNYSKVYFDNAHPLTVAKVLHWFENKLQDDFCRIHNAHIVNRLFISTISYNNNSLTLSNGEELKISRRRKNIVRKMLL